MTFDKARYRKGVLKDLGRDASRMSDLLEAIHEVQTKATPVALASLDLAGLLELPADRSNLESHVEAVKRALNQLGQTMDSAKLLSKLLAEMDAAGMDVTSPALWKELDGAKSQANKLKVEAFADAVVADNQTLRLVTTEQMVESAAAQGLASVPETELIKAVEAKGIAVRPDFAVPTVPIPAFVADVGKHPEYRSIVDVLLLGPGSAPNEIRVVDDLRFGPGSGTPITASHIQAAQKAASSGKDTDALQAAQKALTSIRTEFSDAGKLHQMVLAHFLDSAQKLLDRGELKSSALTRLTDRVGLDKVDAARILSKLSVSTTRAKGLDDVNNALADGVLGDARNIFDALDRDSLGPVDVERVEAKLLAAEQRKAAAVAAYETAMKSRNFADAARALAAAVGIDKSDQRLQDLIESLPPAAPEGVAAKQRADGTVALTWRQDGAQGIKYSVIRSDDGHAPANTADGVQLAMGLTTGSFLDPKPAVAVPIHYSVFAIRNNAASLPTSAEVLVLPAPSDVSVSTSLTEITVMWRLAPQAVGVQISQVGPDGSSKPVSPRADNRVTLNGLTTGARYRYTLAAIYVLPTGERMLSSATTVEASPRGSASAVKALTVVGAALPDGRDGHRATWAAVPGFSVELWAFPIDEQLPAAGAETVIDELQAIDGKRVNGTAELAGDTEGLRFARLSDLRAVAAVTIIDGTRAMMGDSAIVGAAPPVSNAHVDRNGDELVVSWELPHGDFAAQVTWTSVGGVTKSQKCTRADYRATGGFRIASAADVENVSVSTVAFGNGREWVAEPVMVELPERISVVRYEMTVPQSRLGKRKPATIRVFSEDYTGQMKLLVVVRDKAIMPSRPDDGTVIKQLELAIDPGVPTSAEVELPKLHSPFWVRLFAAESSSSVKLLDPPTSQMKG